MGTNLTLMDGTVSVIFNGTNNIGGNTMISIDDIKSATPEELIKLQNDLVEIEPEQTRRTAMKLVVDGNSAEHGIEYYAGIRRAIYAMKAFVGTPEIASRMDEYAEWMWLNQMVTARESQLEKEQAAPNLPL